MNSLPPPQDLVSEAALLGSAMLNDAASAWIADRLPITAFYSNANRAVFSAIKMLRERKEPVDIVSVGSVLLDSKKLAEAGGPEYLKSLLDKVGWTGHFEYYGKCVLRTYFDREIEKAAYSVKDASGAQDDEARDKALDLMSELCRDRCAIDISGDMSIGQAMHQVLDDFEKGPAKMVKTGIEPLDDLTGGQERGDLMTLGARTGVGKTATLLSMALNMAKAGERVAFCAGEMSGVQVGKRALASESGVEHWKIRLRKVDRPDLPRLNEAASRLSTLPLYFCNIPSPTLKEIKTFADSVQATVVIIDYLTRCRLPKADTMRVSVNLFMQGVKNLAVESQRVVILASQINRAMDRSDNRRPTLADLKESGAIEEESDQVVLLHATEEAKMGKGIVSITAAVAKNRHGKIGAVELQFDKDHMRVGSGHKQDMPQDRQLLAANDGGYEDAAF